MKRENLLRRYHKEMWTWLAANPDKRKEHWPGWKKVQLTLLRKDPNNWHVWTFHCFACGVRSIPVKILDECGLLCPIKQWTPGTDNDSHVPCTASRMSLYSKWGNERNLELKAEYAKKIADAWE